MATKATLETLIDQIADAIADRVVARIQESPKEEKKPETKPTRGRGRPAKAAKSKPKEEDDDLGFDSDKTEIEDSENLDENSIDKIKEGMRKLIKKHGQDFRSATHQLLEELEWKSVGNGTLDEFLEHRGKTFAKRLKKLAADYQSED